jgi:hypothetical protein
MKTWRHEGLIGFYDGWVGGIGKEVSWNLALFSVALAQTHLPLKDQIPRRPPQQHTRCPTQTPPPIPPSTSSNQTRGLTAASHEGNARIFELD